jgi:hypothetical protein
MEIPAGLARMHQAQAAHFAHKPSYGVPNLHEIWFVESIQPQPVIQLETLAESLPRTLAVTNLALIASEVKMNAGTIGMNLQCFQEHGSSGPKVYRPASSIRP